MPAVTLKAYFDGKQIVLDEPFDLPVGSHLLVTVVPPSLADSEREEWHALSKANLARAYGDNEPEYSLRDLRLPH